MTRVAAYARFSSDQQREASLEDQLRNCRAFAARQGWPEPAVFTDAAVSGARNDRPGYAALIAAAQAHAFDVILVDDLSRLSRDSIESAKAVKRLTFAGVRLIGVSDGIDTSRKDAKVGAGLRGLMSELYLDDLADKTHRGLTGRALAGASAGGLPYGYRVGGTAGERVIDPAQAAIVRRIYAEFLAGQSPRAIAVALNRDGVRSPRGSTWAVSAIAPDHARGIGILANPIYAGRQVWNRSRFVKHPETGRRVRQERPQAEWITTEHPELAIVDVATWAAVRARVGHRDNRPGRRVSHLLSGLLRCGECGGPVVKVDRYRYGCATAKDRGTCASKARPRIEEAERAMLAGVRERFLSDAAFEEARKHVQAALKRRQPDVDAARRRLQDAERLRENILAAIRAGILTPSTKAELEAAEDAVAAAGEALRASAPASPAVLLPRLREVWKGMVANLDGAARRSPKARDALRALIGEATLKTANGALVAEIAPSQIVLVAGAGFGHWLREPVRIELGRA